MTITVVRFLISSRSRQRAPNVITLDLCSARNRAAGVSSYFLAQNHALASAVASEYSWCKPPNTEFASTIAPAAN